MSAATQPTTDVQLPGPATVAYRRHELATARMMGVGVGIFLLVWGPLSLVRWQGVGPAWANFESGFDIFFGILLLLPYSRIRSTWLWRRLMAVLLGASILFIFVLVFDVLYVANLYVENTEPPGPPPAETSLYADADDNGPPLPMPVLNCALVFLALMQVPVVYFMRHPDQMD
jgi:hypothetical protein